MTIDKEKVYISIKEKILPHALSHIESEAECERMLKFFLCLIYLEIFCECAKLERGLEHDNECGLMSHSAGLIVGGQLSKRSQFPWIAIISIENDEAWSHQGSGSLISNRHVLADAKSVSFTNSLNNLEPVASDRVKIFLGAIEYNELSAFSVGVSKIINHPDARELLESLDINRISIITLDRSVIFSDFIRPVCMWSYSADINEIIGRDAFAVGYGSDHTGNDTLIRKHARMIVTDDETCRNNFSDEFDEGMDSTFFCVKGNGTDGPCYLDNQLYMKIGSQWYLRGISSTISTLDDDNNCDVNSPALYEDIAPFKAWIERQINSN